MTPEGKDLMVTALRAVPSHREPPLSVHGIALAASGGIASEQHLGAAAAVVTILNLFDALSWDGDRCRLQNQLTHYFRESLLWYLANGKTLLTDWTRRGTSRDVRVRNLTEAAPYFLRAIEERRLSLSQRAGIDSGASRTVGVSIVLLKAIGRRREHFLHCWDSEAEQYQLVGGRRREGEAPIDCARREFFEEAGFQDLPEHARCVFSPLQEEPIVYRDISRTYGALTEYQVWFFAASVEHGEIAPAARWISVDEMNSGMTTDHKRVAQIFRRLERQHPGALAELQPSPVAIESADDSARSTPGSTIYYGPVIGSVVGSQVQQDTCHSSQSVHAGLQLAEVAEIVEGLLRLLPQLSLKQEDKHEVAAQLDTIASQTRARNPSPSTLRSAWLAARPILEHAAGHALGASVVHSLPLWVARLSALLG